ncbi:hypothetical protein SRHO_G00061170 [Serrasalmus rhombeus]
METMANSSFSHIATAVAVACIWAPVCAEACSVFFNATCENGTATLDTTMNITEDLNDCEGGLYNKSGVLLSDASPFGKAKTSVLIKKVTFWNLTITSCPSEIHWNISCNTLKYFTVTSCYRITEETSPEHIAQPNDEASNQRHRLLMVVPLAVFMVVVVVIGGTLARDAKNKWSGNPTHGGVCTHSKRKWTLLHWRECRTHDFSSHTTFHSSPGPD